LLSAYGLEEEQKQQLVKFQLFLLEWTAYLKEHLSQPASLPGSAPLAGILSSPAIQSLLQVNTYQEITWFHRESYYLFVLAGKVILQLWPEDVKKLLPAFDLSAYFAFAEASQYKLDALLALFKAQTGDPV
jgi:hypothetical protein